MDIYRNDNLDKNGCLIMFCYQPIPLLSYCQPIVFIKVNHQIFQILK